MQWKVGQIITSTAEHEIVTGLFEKKVKIPAGNKIIIGADKLAHHIYSGITQPISSKIDIGGYDAEGLAEYLTFCLKNKWPMEGLFEAYDIEDDFKEELQSALEKIGF